MLGASALILTLNAWRYPWDNGYDAHEHAAYADYVVERGAIPTDRTNEHYYTPPGYYAVAGAIDELGIAIGLREPQQRKLVQLFNVPLVLATALLTFLLARLLWPQRRLLQVAAAAFVAFTPVVVKTGAMFHPETLSLFLSTLGLYVAARLIARGRLGWLPGPGARSGARRGTARPLAGGLDVRRLCVRAAPAPRRRRRAPPRARRHARGPARRHGGGRRLVVRQADRRVRQPARLQAHRVHRRRDAPRRERRAVDARQARLGAAPALVLRRPRPAGALLATRTGRRISATGSP